MGNGAHVTEHFSAAVGESFRSRRAFQYSIKESSIAALRSLRTRYRFNDFIDRGFTAPPEIDIPEVRQILRRFVA